MIITDIAQIDRIAEKTFGTTKGIVSVDMNDYIFIKEHSESLKMIKLEVPSLTERTILIDVDDNGKIFDAYNRAYSNPKDLVDDVTEEFIDMNRELNKQKVYSNNMGQ